MRALTTSLTLSLLLAFTANAQQNQRTFKQKNTYMGCECEVFIVGTDSAKANRQFEEIWKKMAAQEDIFAFEEIDSEISRMNKMAPHGPVKVSESLYSLLKRSLILANLSQGAYDPTYVPLDSLWLHIEANNLKPDSTLIRRTLGNVGFKKVEMNPNDTTVAYRNPKVRIKLQSIEKGYILNQIRRYMEYRGIHNGAARMCDDVIAWGEPAPNKKWFLKDLHPDKIDDRFAFLTVNNLAHCESRLEPLKSTGQPRKYSHIIDPRTGWPVENVTRVVVIGPNAELADALATAVFVMGRDMGLSLINQLKEFECIFEDHEGNISVSDNLSHLVFETSPK